MDMQPNIQDQPLNYSRPWTGYRKKYYRPGLDHTTNYFRQGYSLNNSLSDHNRNLGINNSILCFARKLSFCHKQHFLKMNMELSEHKDGFNIRHKCRDSEKSSVKSKHPHAPSSTNSDTIVSFSYSRELYFMSFLGWGWLIRALLEGPSSVSWESDKIQKENHKKHQLRDSFKFFCPMFAANKTWYRSFPVSDLVSKIKTWSRWSLPHPSSD